jgi:hypothetical protein
LYLRLAVIFIYLFELSAVMKTKNFKRADEPNVKFEPNMTLQMVEAEEKRLDLRHTDSSVLRLIEAKEKHRKELFDKGLF